jgi:hypothetical protein
MTGMLGRLETGQAFVIARLDALNGSVARHSFQIIEIEKRNAARDHSCPLLGELQKCITGLHDQIENVQAGQVSDRAADRAEAAADAKWVGWTRPVVLALMGIIGTLLLEHGKEVVAGLKGL